MAKTLTKIKLKTKYQKYKLIQNINKNYISIIMLK